MSLRIPKQKNIYISKFCTYPRINMCACYVREDFSPVWSCKMSSYLVILKHEQNVKWLTHNTNVKLFTYTYSFKINLVLIHYPAF